MKFLAFVVAVILASCALTQTALVNNALAQTSECRSLPDPGQRLACYDMAAPPSAAADKPSAKRTSAGKASKNDAAAGSAQAISDEDAVMNARIKNICRGC